MDVHLRICNEKDFFSMPRSYEKCITHISWYMECTHEVHDSQLHLQIKISKLHCLIQKKLSQQAVNITKYIHSTNKQ